MKEPFARFVVSAYRHPKVVGVPPAARWLWFAATSYCREKETDGHLPRGAVTTLGVDKPWPLVAQLVAAGLLDQAGENYRVHDYDHWQETKAEVRERREEVRLRVEKSRAARAG